MWGDILQLCKSEDEINAFCPLVVANFNNIMFNEKYIRYFYVIFFLCLELMLWKAIVPALEGGEKVCLFLDI